MNHTTEQNSGECRGSLQLAFPQQLQNEGPKFGNKSTNRKSAPTRCMQTGFVLLTVKSASHFLENHMGQEYRNAHPRLLGQGSSILFPAKPKVHSQRKLHPSGCCCSNAGAHKCFSNRSCHQWYFKSQSAPHPPASCAPWVLEVCSHTLSHCLSTSWTNDWPALPPAVLHSFLLSSSLPAEPLMWILLSQEKGTEVSKDQLFKGLWKIQIILT